MNSIRKLDENLVAKIAAGEVVENPAAIVKELVENAIDARASSITVEIEKGGRRFIRVTDDGHGIPADEIPMALERHATSKLFEEKDLYEIRSLGFRGEALSSIAAVSELEITTRTAESPFGTRSLQKCGGLIETSGIGAPFGTTVLVRDLFSKVPARLKFLKSDTIETNRIIDTVNQLAISQNAIRFQLISDKEHLYTTPGNRNLQETVYAVFGKKIAGNLARMDFFYKDMHLHGLISNLQNHHSNKNMQYFFINRRWVKNRMMSDLFNGAFHHLYEKRRYPIGFLFLDIPPSSIDINISPNKTEVKFRDDEAVQKLFRSGCSEFVKQHIWSTDETPAAHEVVMESSARNHAVYPMSAESQAKTFQIHEKAANDICPPRCDEAPDPSHTDYPSPMDALIAKVMNKQKNKDSGNEKLDLQPDRKSTYFKDLKVIGQLFDSYVLCENRDTKELILIDQHAAHEKILYESFVSQLNDKSLHGQIILEPFIWEIPETEKNILLESEPHIRAVGFALEDFGFNALIVREMPAMFSKSAALSFLNELKDMLLKSMPLDRMQSDEMVYAMAVKACHGAIKAKDRLEMPELKKLLRDMDELDNPFTCPHGRPTVAGIGISDIEKYFNR